MKDFISLQNKIREAAFPKLDAVVGIARGAIVPSSMIAEYLNLELDFIWVNRRNELHQIIREEPLVYQMPRLNLCDKKILLVEDRVKSGISLQKAAKILKESFPGIEITTLAVNGKADISLYDEACFVFPWKIQGGRNGFIS